MTLCREVCPMTTGVLRSCKSTFAARRHRPSRSTSSRRPSTRGVTTPARLRAYQREFGADFTMLTGSPRTIREVLELVRRPVLPRARGQAAGHRLVDPQARDVRHRPHRRGLRDRPARRTCASPTTACRSYSASSRARCGRCWTPRASATSSIPQLPWTADQVADDVLNMMGRAIPCSPGGQDHAAERLRRAVAAARVAGRADALHAQADSCSAPTSALSARLHALRGHPVVVNVVGVVV